MEGQGEDIAAACGTKTHSSGGVHDALRRSARASFIAFSLATVTTVLAAQQPGADGPSKALEGRWSLELHLDKPSERFEPMAGQIDGEIDFSSMAWWSPTDRFGRHNLNLQSFFGNRFLKPANVTSFGPGDTSMVTEVSGYVRGDSVGIDFIPRVDHGGVSMWGEFWGDSAKGRWYRRGADGEGHFVLRRLSHDAVAVASIPDGRPTAVAAAAPPPKKLTKAQARALAKKEAVAKAKAHADSVAVARAAARKAAEAAALAKAAARDSAKAVALAETKAKAAARDSAKAVALAEAKAKAAARDSAKAQAVAVAKARRDSIAAARVATARARATENSASPNARATAASANAGSAGTTRLAFSAPGAPPPTPGSAAPGASTAPGAAPLRVRIYDIASNNYFSTKYSLHLPDGHWLYGTLKSGTNPDGWGPPIVEPPGKYEIEVTDFLCGDKIWFLKDKIVKPVVIEPGTPTDVTIDIDVPSTPARPSLENKTGANCTDTPGGKS